MKLKDVVALLEKVMHPALVDDWDNCGLLIGDMEQEITHIRTALEATNEVVDAAVKDGVDLLLVHHPMFFAPVKRITSETIRGKKALKMIASGMALYAAHTNLDRAQNGLNQNFGQAIGIGEWRSYDEGGYILMGKLERTMTLEAYAAYIGERLGYEPIRYVGTPERSIDRVAFCCGSAVNLMDDALFDQVDVYVTGDLKYHDAMDIHEKGQALVDVPHFVSEVMAAKVLHNLVTSVIDSVTVTIDDSIINPIRQ